jgi:hypothetical protein
MSSKVKANDVIIADIDSLIRGVLRSILENDGFTVMQAVDYAARTVAQP